MHVNSHSKFHPSSTVELTVGIYARAFYQIILNFFIICSDNINAWSIYPRMENILLKDERYYE